MTTHTIKTDWRCCGCGKPTLPNLVRQCDCLTGLAYDADDRSKIAPMRRKPGGYDQVCYEVAKHFLSGDPDIEAMDTEENRDELAALVQRAIEDQIEYWRRHAI
jgi:hypothetical protein